MRFARLQTPRRRRRLFKTIFFLAASFVLALREKKKFSINASKASAVEFSRRFDLVLVGSEKSVLRIKEALEKNISKEAVEGVKKVFNMIKVGGMTNDRLKRCRKAANQL